MPFLFTSQNGCRNGEVQCVSASGHENGHLHRNPLLGNQGATSYFSFTWKMAIKTDVRVFSYDAAFSRHLMHAFGFCFTSSLFHSIPDLAQFP